MAIAPDFLDEIRARVGLGDVIARHVSLKRAGRELSGLCPFHNEKTPSFTVSEEKGFFHCFGCGAHGDVIGFVMRQEGLSFPEAVERLASEAGLEVPRATPAEREAERRRANLHDVMERACRFFEAELRSPRGAAALAYLADRRIDEATIARFRLGYAPDSRTALRNAVMDAEHPEALLVEAGLLIRPDGGTPYDRFRGRVIFPIADRRGRVIAFGGRTLGDGTPKYLNSPETPLFDKSRVLYGMATAREAAHRNRRVIVTEGYTDVIALNRAGYAEAVAPLGTALTESHLHELWRMAPEPILCFDGDEAGKRAARRAAERALPLLEPGRSLQFVSLPPGQDPDGLVAEGGSGAVDACLAARRGLVELVWEMNTEGRRFDTPERIAGLEQVLDRAVDRIDNRRVQYQYRTRFRSRLDDRFGFRRGPRRRGGADGIGIRAEMSPETLPRSTVRHIVATLLRHPPLIEEFDERLASLEVAERQVDSLLRRILAVVHDAPGLDEDRLKSHLSGTDAELAEALIRADVYTQWRFAGPNATIESARSGVSHALDGLRLSSVKADLAAAEMALADDPSEENVERLIQLKAELEVFDGEDAVPAGETG
ncbi:MAG: DNA primase [Defluviicoccus sp.]|nr:DNA primase [Defluviicoccus sp.]MDE0386236.1 DNA primase [Defluviicoccus sp.]